MMHLGFHGITSCEIYSRQFESEMLGFLRGVHS